MIFNLVVCGGTFDHFHKGHREFLKACVLYGKKVILGLTNDEYIKKSKIKIQKSKLIELYDIRKKSVEDFLKKENLDNRVKIVKINDLFGPTLLKDFRADAIIVSESSIKGAKAINDLRQKIGLSPFEIVIHPTVYAEDQKPISSSRIRAGEINREGRLYINPIWLSKKLFITESLRRILEKPQGVLVEKISDFKQSNATYIATVGDVTTKIFNKFSFVKNIAVVDFKVGRVKKFKSTKELGFSGNEMLLKVDNPAGCLTPDIFRKTLQAVSLARNNKPIILVEGEEDLAVLPLILTLPLGSIIFYGQRKQGIVRVDVSEEKKENAHNLVSQFKLTI